MYLHVYTLVEFMYLHVYTLVEFMYLHVYTLVEFMYLHAVQVRVTVGDWGLCCCTCVTYFER